MELELNNKLEEKTISDNSFIDSFTKELSETLELKDILTYRRPIDNGKFTDENLSNIDNKYKKVITELIENHEIDDGKVYEVLELGKSYNIIREYNNEKGKVIDFQVSSDELPKDCKTGMILKKEDNEYIIDKEMTLDTYYKMKEYETEILNEQQKYLNKMRKNGELYYVKSVERRL